jgi:hypothetical protein
VEQSSSERSLKMYHHEATETMEHERELKKSEFLLGCSKLCYAGEEKIAKAYSPKSAMREKGIQPFKPYVNTNINPRERSIYMT